MVSPINIPGSGMPGRSGAEPSGSRPTNNAPEPTKVREQVRGAIRTPEDAINALRSRLEQQLQQRLGASGPDASASTRNRFEPPTAADVASRVLGFVQQRLQKEAAAGADSERLAGLLSDARRGVEQGFSEAREQIEALGLMTDTLNRDIDDSFTRIQDGLSDLESRYLQNGMPSESRVAAAMVESASKESFAFEVTTRDGDRVTVRMEEQRYSAMSASARESDGVRSEEVRSASLFLGRYAFSVEGSLDDGEKAALADFFGKVQQVSGRFFDGDIQGAFQAAQSLSLGGDELASFSLNLSATRMVSAAAYESVSREPSSEPSANMQLRPLGSLARDIQGLAQESVAKGMDLQAMEGLMQELLDDIQRLQNERGGENNPAPRSLMDDFLSSVLAAFESAGQRGEPV
ncbi:DUF5610 domain-containing protein [Marinobacter salarius]|uniref:DUF5610 domain-containing protein n=1 Tax=Marinobacter salarius TaxID=1420917 RepID=UPI003D9C502F